MRVVTIGEYIIDNFAYFFPHVDRKLVKSFLSQHDQAKVNPKFNSSQELPLYKQLYLFFGRESATLSKKQIKKRTLVIQRVNEIDEQLAYNFFEKHGLLTIDGEPTETAIDLLRIEKIADLVDRGMNKVTPEEFARQMKPGSDLFERREKKIAKYVERNYKKIIEGEDWGELSF